LQLAASLLLMSLFVQMFIAGMAALTAPEWWILHKRWVDIFQWLTLMFPLFAWLRDARFSALVILSAAPLMQIALQYYLAHRALEGTLRIGLGLHALNAGVLLIVTILIFLQANIAARNDSDTLDNGRQ
jgi:hypothetical protein